MVTRKDLQIPEYYRNYVSLAGGDDLVKALQSNAAKMKKFFRNIPRKKSNYAYAEGKWTIKQLLQHCIDAERVFVLRALWFARQDPSPLPGFDENQWATQVNLSDRRWPDMVDELLSLRESTIAFFSSCNDDTLRLTGTANNITFSVALLGYISAGHVAHHMNILEERYLSVKKEKSPKKEKARKKEKKKKKSEKENPA